MKVTVITGSWARRYVPHGQMELVLPEGASVATMLEHLCIPAEEVGLIAIDDTAVFRQAPLAEGDKATIFPAIFGG